MRLVKCKICGTKFEMPLLGRRQTVCPACKKLKLTVYNRQWKRKHRSGAIELRECKVCGTRYARLHKEGEKTIWLCPNHKAMLVSGRRTIDDYLKEL